MTDRPRTIDLSIEVPGSPEEVWAAIGAGPGISSWFAPCEVDGRPGGAVTTDFGAYGKETARITDWDPPHRFRGEAPFAGQGLLAHEWLVEARAGGTCVVRLVASGFGEGADWDSAYDALSEGWAIFLENLRLHLTYFRGRHARMLHEVGPLNGPNEVAWRSLCEALGVSPALTAGDRFETTGAGVPAVAGTVDQTFPSVYMLRIDTPLPGTGFVSAEDYGDQTSAHVALYLYGDPAVAADTADQWAKWMAAELLPS